MLQTRPLSRNLGRAFQSQHLLLLCMRMEPFNAGRRGFCVVDPSAEQFPVFEPARGVVSTNLMLIADELHVKRVSAY